MRSILEFSDLIKPASPKAFFKDHYGKAPFLTKGDAKLYASLFNWNDFSNLLEMTNVWTGSTLKIVLDEEIIDPATYTRRSGGRDDGSVLRPIPHAVNTWMAKGASVVLDAAEYMHPGLRSITEAISFATNCMVSCNLYCSFDGRQAFTSHYDTTDVFVLQLDGAKKWRVYEGQFENPIEADGYYYSSFDKAHHDHAKGRAKMTPTLKPGSFLYLPKGRYHDACALKGPSLHATFATTEARGVDFLQTIINSMVEVPAFRAALPDFDDAAAHSAHIHDLAEQLKTILQQPEIAAQMREDQKRRAFADISRYQLPKPTPVNVYRVRHIDHSIALGGDGYILDANGKKVAIPADTVDAVKWVLARSAFLKHDLEANTPNLDEAGRRDLLAMLSEIGLLDILTR